MPLTRLRSVFMEDGGSGGGGVLGTKEGIFEMSWAQVLPGTGFGAAGVCGEPYLIPQHKPLRHHHLLLPVSLLGTGVTLTATGG